MDTDVIVVPFSKIEPAVSHRCFELLDMQSTEAVSVQIQGLKIIYLRTEFTNNFHMLPLSKLYEWIKFAIAILNRSCPEELDSIRYEEELPRTVWWKSKKWAAKLLGRLFQRCRYPYYADKHYVFTARKFLTEWAPLAIDSLLVILNAVSNGDHVSDRVLSLILSFTNNAIALSVCWQIVKPHALELIERLLFPILCYGDIAEDRWREDVEEPILFKFAGFKDLLHVAHDAGKLLIGLARTSDVAESIFFFVVQVLSCSVNSREIEGAFRVLGELCVHLTRNKVSDLFLVIIIT
uniref:BLM10_mid domain-containing protein n=1 Tax=Angiostrongylus cantonensis TaxID=6313 RepID=A0A0K0D5Q6_ANGCA